MEINKVPSGLSDKWNEVKADKKISTGDIAKLYNEAIKDGNLAKDEEKFISSLMSDFKTGDRVATIKEGKSESEYQLVLGDENEYKEAMSDLTKTVKERGIDKTDNKEFRGYMSINTYSKLFSDK